MAQRYETPQPRKRETDDTPDDTPAPADQPTAREASEGADDVLDEIDAVLEPNAQDFVKGFVQKGGQ